MVNFSSVELITLSTPSFSILLLYSNFDTLNILLLGIFVSTISNARLISFKNSPSNRFSNSVFDNFLFALSFSSAVKLPFVLFKISSALSIIRLMFINDSLRFFTLDFRIPNSLFRFFTLISSSFLSFSNSITSAIKLL